jgi:hypothetical protein
MLISGVSTVYRLRPTTYLWYKYLRSKLIDSSVPRTINRLRTLPGKKPTLLISVLLASLSASLVSISGSGWRLNCCLLPYRFLLFAALIIMDPVIGAPKVERPVELRKKLMQVELV